MSYHYSNSIQEKFSDRNGFRSFKLFFNDRRVLEFRSLNLVII